MGVSKDASPLLQCGSAQNLGDLRGQFLGAEGSLHLGFVTAIVETRHVGQAGDADETGHSLDRQIHRQIVAIRAGQPLSGAGRIDRPRIDGVQHLEPDIEPVHKPGAKFSSSTSAFAAILKSSRFPRSSFRLSVIARLLDRKGRAQAFSARGGAAARPAAARSTPIRPSASRRPPAVNMPVSRRGSATAIQ